MSSFFKKFPKTTLVLINVFILVVIFLIIELALKIFIPFNVATIGHKFCENAKLYGWGYAPHEQIRNFDPDTGKTYVSLANNHGWRDLDREYENKKGTYRILVLGDSMTFGVLVPAEKMYTRVLEKKLLDQGYNVEVINISYAGWGTDQELEALKHEGLNYHPHLIINQFCMNDIDDNAYSKDTSEERKGWKPFYYELDDQHVLHKRDNPNFNLNSQSLKEKIIHSSEILKRIWAAYLIHKFHNMSSKTVYRVTEDRLHALEMIAHINKDNPLYISLKNQLGKRLSLEEINTIIDASGPNGKQQEDFARIFEDRLVPGVWTGEGYHPKYADKNSYSWRLYFAIVDEMKKYASQAKIPLVLFPELDEGSYQYTKYWFSISEGLQSKVNFLSPRELVRSYARDNGLGFVDNTLLYKRSRNDGHPNIEGNEAMAQDIYNYLIINKKNELESYRMKKDS